MKISSTVNVGDNCTVYTICLLSIAKCSELSPFLPVDRKDWKHSLLKSILSFISRTISVFFTNLESQTVISLTAFAGLQQIFANTVKHKTLLITFFVNFIYCHSFT